jgi:hypothetical protein
MSCSSLSRVLDISKNVSSLSYGNSERSLLSGGVSDSVEADLLGVLDKGLEDGLEVVPDDCLDGGRDDGLDGAVMTALRLFLKTILKSVLKTVLMLVWMMIQTSDYCPRLSNVDLVETFLFRGL